MWMDSDTAQKIKRGKLIVGIERYAGEKMRVGFSV